MSPKQTYSLPQGTADLDRLALLNRYYNPGSHQLLDSVGLAGKRVADIGCGHGEMTHWLAERVGERGSVVGVDVSAEQLELAAAGGTHPNRTTWTCSAADRWQPEGKFDVVYSRLLLIHVPDPTAVLRAMVSALRPGGALVIETAQVSALRYVPEDPEAHRWRPWWYAIGDAIGASYRFNGQAMPLVRSLGLTIERAQVHQPVSYDREAKLLHPLGYRQLLPVLRDKLGIPLDQLQRQERAFAECVESPDTYVELYTMLQIIARS